jgi:hypothetical protein
MRNGRRSLEGYRLLLPELSEIIAALAGPHRQMKLITVSTLAAPTVEAAAIRVRRIGLQPPTGAKKSEPPRRSEASGRAWSAPANDLRPDRRGYRGAD